MALDKGAQAVIFDVSDDATAAADVSAAETHTAADACLEKKKNSLCCIFPLTHTYTHTASRLRFPSPSSRPGGG